MKLLYMYFASLVCGNMIWSITGMLPILDVVNFLEYDNLTRSVKFSVENTVIMKTKIARAFRHV